MLPFKKGFLSGMHIVHQNGLLWIIISDEEISFNIPTEEISGHKHFITINITQNLKIKIL